MPLETLAVSQVQSEGMAAFQRGDFQEAREAYLRVLRVEPSNRSALANLGATEYRLGNNEDSERPLRRALQLKTDNPTAWLNLGILNPWLKFTCTHLTDLSFCLSWTFCPARKLLSL